MKTKATAGILAGLLACSLVGGGCTLLGAKADVVGRNAEEWGSSSASATYAADGFVELGGITWGSRNWYKDKVKLDGLTIQMNVSNFGGNSFGGFYFANNQNAYFGDGSPITFSHWQNMNGWGTNRFSVAANHDANGAQLIYRDAECTAAGFGYGADTHVMIMNVVAETHYTISFESYSDTAYKVRIALSDADTLHTNHPNYGTAEGSYYCDGYIKKETVASVVDENGYTMLCFSVPNDAGKFNVKISDDNIREYQTTQVPAAQEKVTAYEEAEITDEASYDAAMTLREQALTAVNGLKGREKTELSERIAAVDDGYKTNDTVQTTIKAMVQDKVDEADEAFAAIFGNESTLTDDSVDAAKNKLIAAENAYDAIESMLSDENKEELTAAIDATNYSSNRIAVLQWVVNYENAIDELDTTAATIGEDIAAVKATRNAFTGSYLETLLNNWLKDEHKTAYTARITAADEALGVKEEDAAVAVKTAYVVAFEDTLESLTTYSKITSAFNAKNTLEANITLTEEDGELYTRFNAGVETLYTGLETFITNAIASVSTSLDGKFETLASFTSVRGDYRSISLDLLDEDRAATATITAAYEALTEKLESNVWYNFAQTGLSKVEQNETGIYFEQPGPKFPDRINYNKKLDLTKGVEVVVEFTQIAFYNGDKTEDGSNKGANNLSINFLNRPNGYKSQAEGINIIIWLFETESSVDIVNGSDQSVARGVIATPINGGRMTITLKHDANYYDFASDETYAAYVLNINGTEIVMTDTIAEANGLNISDECYFSFGSFADYKEDPNCFTLISVDGEKFAKKDEPVVKPPVEEKPDPEKPTPEKPANKGCGSEIGAYSLLAACMTLALGGVAVAIAVKSKKNEE